VYVSEHLVLVQTYFHGSVRFEILGATSAAVFLVILDCLSDKFAIESALVGVVVTVLVLF